MAKSPRWRHKRGMTANRFVELIAFILIPIALIREVWWSRVLFGKPWERGRPEGLEALDLGGLSALQSGIPAMVLTLVVALVTALGLNALVPLFKGRFLAFVQLAALAVAANVIAGNPAHGFVGFWIMGGFCLVAFNLIGAFLLRE